MGKFNIDILKGIDMSIEGVEKRQKESHKRANDNLENMSYWLPKIQQSTTQDDSILKIPETKIVPLDFDWYKWLKSDNYSPEKITEFNDYLVSEIGDFVDKKLFMKSGVFSNKFNFVDTVIDDKEEIGEKFLNIYYSSMLLGADNTSEAVFREMIEDVNDKPKIYNGMPLHTEFRVFFDFDNDKVVGVSNYWHPDVMGEYISTDDLASYESVKEELINEYNNFKVHVTLEIHKFMKGVNELKGQWSVDVMKNGDDYWLIDMARMERSALVDKIENI